VDCCERYGRWMVPQLPVRLISSISANEGVFLRPLGLSPSTATLLLQQERSIPMAVEFRLAVVKEQQSTVAPLGHPTAAR